MLLRRVIDAAGTTPGVRVLLRGRPVPVAGFEDYVRLFRARPESDSAPDVVPVAYVRVNKHWEIATCVAEDADAGDVVSFVNGTCTLRGGSHVAYIADQLCKRAAELIGKRNPGMALGAHARITRSHADQFF